ncbi:flagellar basal body rod protein FlgB [Candidatus Sumerlaeota bacterium]|nr:flagellar basal body rod protein FlgB [Candidatus Sumerlaeota bacterium]
MIENALFGRTFEVLERSLDVRQIRHGMIAANLANSETPGYRAVDVEFGQTMQNIIQRVEDSESGMEIFNADDSAAEKIGGGMNLDDLEIKTDDAELVGRDSNTVSMENEIAKMQENRMMYGIVAQLLARRFKGLSDAITSGSQG